MGKGGVTRSQLCVFATGLLVFVIVQVALAGGSEPKATTAANKQVKKLTARVAALEARVNQGTPAPPAPSLPTSLPPNGPAGGDLAGAYPSPSLRPPDSISAGLPDSNDSIPFCPASPVGEWYDAPSIDQPVGAYRDRQGTVFLQGVAERCLNSGTHLIFTLPPGLRPAKVVGSASATSSGSAADAILVQPNGDVFASQPPSAPGFEYLDGISFRCGPSGQNGCP
jgi:hypothetical protein